MGSSLLRGLVQVQGRNWTFVVRELADGVAVGACHVFVSRFETVSSLEVVRNCRVCIKEFAGLGERYHVDQNAADPFFCRALLGRHVVCGRFAQSRLGVF